MPKVQIITERLSSLAYDFAEKNNIFIFPVSIILKNDVFKDDNDIKAAKFLKKLETLDEIPSTAVPSLGEMEIIFEKATKDIKKAIYISASKKLSGIYNVGVKIAEKLKKQGKDIRVFDSYTTVSMEGMYAFHASLLAKEGKDIDEIMQSLEKIKQERRIIEYGVLETLKYLVKNGRIGKAKSWIANLFSFKPIISAKDGVLEPVAKVRTNAQGIEAIIKRIKEDIKRTRAKKIKIMYDYGISDAYIREEVDPRIRKEFNPDIISFNQISTAIACHLGPEIWGVCILLQ